MKERSRHNSSPGFACRCLVILLALVIAGLTLVSCTAIRKKEESGDYDAQFGRGNDLLRIVAGSENRVLEPILDAYAQKKKMRIAVDYRGSLDIMRLLQGGTIPYDAVWPASSLWISMGDEKHRVRDGSSTSITPVVLGVRQTLARELGWTEGPVYVRDLLTAIREGRLRFTMTSATQSNSGASAYMGFLYALLGQPAEITLQDLRDPGLQEDLRELLGGIERSSGSSDWLKDLYLKGDYDAMVNYEALIIDANRTLEAEGRETLYVIYLEDGTLLADSPLAFVTQNGEADRDEAHQEKLFEELLEHLLSEPVQLEIQKTGRRTDLNGVAPGLDDIFRADQGIDTKRILSTINMPRAEVLLAALELYQDELRRPGYNIYLLDHSGSMSGSGIRQLRAALELIMDQKRSGELLLQASEEEINVFIPFSDYSHEPLTARGPVELEALRSSVSDTRTGGGTALFGAVEEALKELAKTDLGGRRPAIIVLTDGMNTASGSQREVESVYRQLGLDVPIFAILFGDAHADELEGLAAMSHGRVFDGREDLVQAFATVRGYN
ncbi:MAG: substrate-binding domain-containing protein [Bacillota bacterium]|nr:substrate-binding domain-containing protein [Bacillota bacterium]